MFLEVSSPSLPPHPCQDSVAGQLCVHQLPANPTPVLPSRLPDPRTPPVQSVPGPPPSPRICLSVGACRPPQADPPSTRAACPSAG
jgi:hypothetical protein